jgi:two-component system chemotaxis sensor kinase CheA
MDPTQYIDLFIEESKEQLQKLNQCLLQVESNPESIEGINEIFRAAHTLKGMAGTMGFKAIASLTHSMENALDAIKSNKLKPAQNVTDLLFECLDALENLVGCVVNTGSDREIDIGILIKKLDSLTGTAINEQKEINVLQKQNELSFDTYQLNIIEQGVDRGFIPYFIRVQLSKDCLLKSARAYVVFKAIEGLGDIIHSAPSVQDIEQEKFDMNFSIKLISRAEKDAIITKLSNISEVDNVYIKRITEDDLYKAKSLMQNICNAETQDQVSNKILSKSSEVSMRLGKSIRVDTERLDHLMNLVSELIIIKNRIQGTDRSNDMQVLSETVEYLGKVTNDIHDAVMKVRMVQVETVFNRFPRVVRDLAKSTGKEVKLNIYGAGTELDRVIADEIGDSLIHLIRNAVDHGLESTNERVSSGKSSTGNVDLIAYHDGNNVVLVVGDDGKGIDTDKILKQALTKGLVNKDETYNLSEREIISFLFDPRISTAGKVSDISGRGVGMDAVKSKVESLGGIIEIETVKGKGTKFIIRLPLTLSIIQALVVKVSHEYFALPLNSIREILNVKISAIKQLRNQEVVDYRDTLIPLTRLDKRLKTPKAEEVNKHDGNITLVILSKGEKLSAVKVDDLAGQQEIVIKSLGKYLSGIKVLSGATILGDGRVVPILDINHLVP